MTNVVKMPEIDSTPVWKLWIISLIITGLVFACYWNTLDNEFLTWDDRKYIYENQLVIGDGGLKAIWTDLPNRKPKTNYYPLTFSTFWIEHQLVGITPPNAESRENVGQPAHPLYHLTQMLLHSINAILLIFVLRQLGVGFYPTIFTAAIFALHPVNVASVAWISERKNLLSGMFFWLSLLCYLRYRRNTSSHNPNTRTRGLRQYGSSLGLFLLALLGKSAALTLAPVLIAVDRVLDRKWCWKSLWRALPFFGIGFIMMGVTVYRSAYIAKSWEPVDLWLRPFIAISAIVHYILKMLLPFNQAILYPRWAESLAEPRYWLSLLFVMVMIGLVRRYRRSLPDLWFWGLLLFLITISPMLGFKHFSWMQFAFVSDHYMYIGGTGVILMVCLMVDQWCRHGLQTGTGPHPKNRAKIRPRIILALSFAFVFLAICCCRVGEQNRTWKNNFTLWTHTLSINPDSFVANLNLGNHYRRKGDLQSALTHYIETVRIRPDLVRGKRDAARCLGQLERVDAAIAYYRAAVKTANRKNPRSWSVHTEYADYLFSRGRVKEALAEYEMILKKNPPNKEKIKQKIRTIRSR